MSKDIEPTTIGEELKAMRLNRLMTLEKVSEASGVSIHTLSDIENGKVNPHDLTVAKIRKALDKIEEVA